MNMLEHIGSLIRGEFFLDEATRKRYAIDGSIFTLTPAAVLVPKDAADIQAVAHYLYTQAASGKKMPGLTARGNGSDQAGGPLTEGIAVDMQKHMNQILEIGADFVRCEPGVRYGELQKELRQRGRYVPAYPASLEFSTIGGAVANNASGEKTVKHGDTREYVQAVKVVLANGDEVTFKDLTPRELELKMHHYTFENKIYREIKRLLDEHRHEEGLPKFHVTKNSSGYAVWEVEKRGLFNLARLMVGSQGTLGIITEITLRTVPYPEQFVLVAGFMDSLDKAAQAIEEILPLGPSAMEVVDQNLLTLVKEQHPGYLTGLIPKQMPDLVLLIEFDDADDHARNGKWKATRTILEKYGYENRLAHDAAEQEKLWRLRRLAAAVVWTSPHPEKAIPIVEDGIVPTPLLPEFFRRAYALFEKHGVKAAVWGHAGDANLHMQPFLNLASEADRAKIWPLIEAFHSLVMDMGGCISAEHNDGLLRSPYLKEQYGAKVYGIFKEIKAAFDPYGFLNPGKKIDVSLESIKPLVRHGYGLEHLIEDRELLNR